MSKSTCKPGEWWYIFVLELEREPELKMFAEPEQNKNASPELNKNENENNMPLITSETIRV